MRVLITNMNLWPPSGTVLYARDLALELHRQGHTPIVFSSTEGAVAAELRDAGITVTGKLSRMREAPDIIHGHHHAPALVALRRWPAVPAIFVCHDHTSPNDALPRHANIQRYLGVSRVCVQRLIGEGAPADRTVLLPNFVDLARSLPRPPLPERPRRALIFSNYANEGTHLPAVTEACGEAGLELDVVGEGVGRVVYRPEALLPDYDIVFAKAKAAMEAMAVGTAVILCDFSGVGPMVTSARFDELRPLNFGFEALRAPLRPEALLREIACYDPEDARRVQDLIRTRAGLDATVERLVGIYGAAIEDYRNRRLPPNGARTGRWSIGDSLFLRLYWSLSPERRRKIKTLPGVQAGWRTVRRVLRQAK